MTPRSSLEVDLELPARRFGAVGRLVAAGIASRLEITADRVDELQLAFDTVFRQSASDDVLPPGCVLPRTRSECSSGRSSSTTASGRISSAYSSALVDDVTSHQANGDVWVDLHVSLDPLAAASR